MSYETENVPIFLRKTYSMIDTCDPRIATWSEDGLSFVVKDVDRFSSEILGQFFKHNKFSSFVRQLNFYGFRKIKDQTLRLPQAGEDEETKHCKFKHEHFQRGRLELLAEIRKSNQSETATKNEVEYLKKKVKDLRSELLSEIQKSNHSAALHKQETEGLKNEVEELRTALSATSKELKTLSSYFYDFMKNQSVVYDVYVTPENATEASNLLAGMPSTIPTKSTKRKQSWNETNDTLDEDVCTGDDFPSPVKSMPQPFSSTTIESPTVIKPIAVTSLSPLPLSFSNPAPEELKGNIVSDESLNGSIETSLEPESESTLLSPEKSSSLSTATTTTTSGVKSNNSVPKSQRTEEEIEVIREQARLAAGYVPPPKVHSRDRCLPPTKKRAKHDESSDLPPISSASLPGDSSASDDRFAYPEEDIGAIDGDFDFESPLSSADEDMFVSLFEDELSEGVGK